VLLQFGTNMTTPLTTTQLVVFWGIVILLVILFFFFLYRTNKIVDAKNPGFSQVTLAVPVKKI